MKDELPPIHTCQSCGGNNQRIEASRPEGRQRDIYRVVCECGHASLQWSVSESAAIRLWNRYMTQGA